MTADYMSGLDPEQIFRIRRDLDRAETFAASTAAPVKMPSVLCAEIANLLYLLELAVRSHQDFSGEDPSAPVMLPQLLH